MRHLTRDPVAGIFSSFGPQSSQWDNEDKRRQVHAERRIHCVFGLNLLLLKSELTWLESAQLFVEESLLSPVDPIMQNRSE